jgi:hypothetical protein
MTGKPNASPRTPIVVDASDPTPNANVKVTPKTVPPKRGGVWCAMNVLLIVPSAKYVHESRMLKRIKSVGTDPVSLEGEKSKFSIEVPLRPPYTLVEITGSSTVKVTVDIKEKILEKEFNNLDINFVNFDNLKYEADGSVVTELTFEGPFSIINNLNSKDIELYVDGSEIKSPGNNKTHNLKVSVSYPHKDILKLTKQTPKTIAVKLN